MSDMKGTAPNRGTPGRKRIEMKRIVKEDSRQVCFSKRRNGLIKKANELCVLCGSSVALIAFSPGGKAYSYGHPSLEAVLDRFLGHHHSVPAEQLHPQPSSSTRRLQSIGESLREDIAAEKRKRDLAVAKFQEQYGSNRFGFFWDSDVNDLTHEQRDEFLNGMSQLRSALRQRARELMANTCHDSNTDTVPPGEGL